MKEFPVSRVFTLLEPGPVVMVTTSDGKRANVMTMSWHMMLDFDPPIIAVCVSEGNHSFSALKKTKECVLSIPPAEMARTVVDIGNCSGRDTDKFARFPITPLPAGKVAAPLIKECIANIECKVIDTRMVGKYNMFILKGVKAWAKPGYKKYKTMHATGEGYFKLDGETLNLRKYMVKFKDLI